MKKIQKYVALFLLLCPFLFLIIWTYHSEASKSLRFVPLWAKLYYLCFVIMLFFVRFYCPFFAWLDPRKYSYKRGKVFSVMTEVLLFLSMSFVFIIYPLFHEKFNLTGDSKWVFWFGVLYLIFTFVCYLSLLKVIRERHKRHKHN